MSFLYDNYQAEKKDFGEIEKKNTIKRMFVSGLRITLFVHIYIYIYIYIYMCVCVCVCRLYLRIIVWGCICDCMMIHVPHSRFEVVS